LSRRKRDAAEEQHFPKLSLWGYTLSAKCVQALKQALRSLNLNELELYEVEDQNGRRIESEILPCIEHFTHLRLLKISVATLKPMEKRSLVDLLSKNTIEDLDLVECSFAEELSDALATAFPRMSALQKLRIWRPAITDDRAFRRLISSASNLHLKEFELYGMAVPRQPTSSERSH
jgi:hypothetical protein